MDAVLKERWLEALRSGRYKQGRCCLRNADDNAHCCLGVLCDLIDPNGWKLPEGSDEYAWGSVGNRCEVPDKEASAVGLTSQAFLMSMNDDLKAPSSFPDIADWIEKNL